MKKENHRIIQWSMEHLINAIFKWNADQLWLVSVIINFFPTKKINGNDNKSPGSIEKKLRSVRGRWIPLFHATHIYNTSRYTVLYYLILPFFAISNFFIFMYIKEIYLFIMCNWQNNESNWVNKNDENAHLSAKEYGMSDP